jgi:hypothetical protein
MARTTIPWKEDENYGCNISWWESVEDVEIFDQWGESILIGKEDIPLLLEALLKAKYLLGQEGAKAAG